MAIRIFNALWRHTSAATNQSSVSKCFDNFTCAYTLLYYIFHCASASQVTSEQSGLHCCLLLLMWVSIIWNINNFKHCARTFYALNECYCNASAIKASSFTFLRLSTHLKPTNNMRSSYPMLSMMNNILNE